MEFDADDGDVQRVIAGGDGRRLTLASPFTSG
jgi:hypothetical protein